MPQARAAISVLLDRLEKFYGPQEPSFPTDPYEFLMWWHCGYPASDAACAKGWSKLTQDIGFEPKALLRAAPQKMAAALKPGGMFPELRAQRLKEIAFRIENEFGGDLRAGLAGPIPGAKRKLKAFPGIADPGADRILLFAGIAPVAAVPSNCVHVLERIVKGTEGKNYSAAYRDAQREISTATPENCDGRVRAYLLVKRHGQECCKRTKPKCEQCPISAKCAYFARLDG